MGRFKTLLLSCCLFFLGSGLAIGQGAPPPDCLWPFVFTSAPATFGPLDNRGAGCNTFTLWYQSGGFTATFNLTLNSADGVNAPGSFSTYSGSVASGTNPLTSIVKGQAQFNGPVSWLQVALSAGNTTGTVRGVLYGYKTGYPGASTGGAGSCNVSTFADGSVVFVESAKCAQALNKFFFDPTNNQLCIGCNSFGGDISQKIRIDSAGDGGIAIGAGAGNFAGYETVSSGGGGGGGDHAYFGFAKAGVPAWLMAGVFNGGINYQIIQAPSFGPAFIIDHTTLEMTVPELGGSGNRCIHVDNAGKFSVFGSDCSAGGGSTNQNIRTVGATFVNGGSALTGTTTTCTVVYFAGTIQQVDIIADQTGSATIDVQSVAFASYTGPGSASSITDGHTPALASAVTFSDSTLTSWTTAVTANSVFCFVLTSPTTITTAEIVLKIAAS